jgi:hypothetical protein
MQQTMGARRRRRRRGATFVNQYVPHNAYTLAKLTSSRIILWVSGFKITDSNTWRSYCGSKGVVIMPWTPNAADVAKACPSIDAAIV